MPPHGWASGEGDQDRPPQNLPLWHTDYSELKAVEKPPRQDLSLKKKNYLWLRWVFVAACRRSSCGEWASQWGGFSCCAARALGCAGSGVAAMSRVALRHVDSSWTRDWTHVPCIGMWTPNHWTTREAQDKTFLKSPLMPQSITCTGMRGGNLITGGREQHRQESA